MGLIPAFRGVMGRPGKRTQQDLTDTWSGYSSNTKLLSPLRNQL